MIPSCEKVTKCAEKTNLNAILDKVNRIYKEDPRQVKWIIKMYTDTIQNHRRLALMQSENHTDQPQDINIDLDLYCSLSWDKWIARNPERKHLQKAYNLTTEPFFSNIWEKDRFCNTLLKIGSDVNNPFRQDSNHISYYIHPIGAIFVRNGNHSVNAGMMKMEGSITPSEVLDWTIEYERNDIFFDGSKFKSRSLDDIKINSPKELGILFEIGRFLYEKERSSDEIQSPVESE